MMSVTWSQMHEVLCPAFLVGEIPDPHDQGPSVKVKNQVQSSALKFSKLFLDFCKIFV